MILLFSFMSLKGLPSALPLPKGDLDWNKKAQFCKAKGLNDLAVGMMDGIPISSFLVGL